MSQARFVPAMSGCRKRLDIEPTQNGDSMKIVQLEAVNGYRATESTTFRVPVVFRLKM
jgi:hypothetical protein